MKKLTFGLTLGIVLGLALQSLAGFENERSFLTEHNRTYQLGYVAGIYDALEAVNDDDSRLLQTTVTLTLSCMKRQRTLGELTEWAIRRVEAKYPTHTMVNAAADSIVVYATAHPCD